jgi:hypothetical protein
VQQQQRKKKMARGKLRQQNQQQTIWKRRRKGKSVSECGEEEGRRKSPVEEELKDGHVNS